MTQIFMTLHDYIIESIVVAFFTLIFSKIFDFRVLFFHMLFKDLGTYAKKFATLKTAFENAL
jgi:hypothetical protein